MPNAAEPTRVIPESRFWSVAIGLTLVALVVVSTLLVLSAARVDLPALGGIEHATTTLSLLVAALAVIATGGALTVLRRQTRVAQGLRRSEQTFQGILTIAADAIITIDGDHRVVHFNHGAELMFGYPASAMIGQPLALLIPGRFRTEHPKHIRNFEAGSVTARRMGERRAIFGLRQSGEEFPAEASISKLTVDGAALFNVVLRDVTDARKQDGRQRFLAGTSVTLNASLDYESILRSVANVAVPYLCDCAVLHTRDAVGDFRCVASVHEDPIKSRALQVLEAGNETWPEIERAFHAVDVRAVAQPWHADTSTNWDSEHARQAFSRIEAHTTVTVPLRSRQSTVAVLTMILTDDKRQCSEDDCELAIQVAERAAHAIDNAALYEQATRALRARDEVLGVVSHDLRNPLSAIGMCARVLETQPPEDANARRELAENILSSVHMMHVLIRDLLDAVMIESGHLTVSPASTEVSRLIEQSLAMIAPAATERGLVAQVEDGTAGVLVQADPMRIVQVLGNLLSNSVKFTPSDGRVLLRTVAEAGVVRFEVEDSGCGIPATSLPHIFDRYWHAQRHSRTAGTGLGLAIAKGIVEAHGGRLSVWSVEGQGTRFTFTLPLSAEPHSRDQRR